MIVSSRGPVSRRMFAVAASMALTLGTLGVTLARADSPGQTFTTHRLLPGL